MKEKHNYGKQTKPDTKPHQDNDHAVSSRGSIRLRLFSVPNYPHIFIVRDSRIPDEYYIAVKQEDPFFIAPIAPNTQEDMDRGWLACMISEGEIVHIYMPHEPTSFMRPVKEACSRKFQNKILKLQKNRPKN
jgi:hypothetical protein